MTSVVDDYGWNEVDNSTLLKKIFGYWPAFHDAHILSIRMDHGKRGPGLVDVVLELHHWGQDDPNWTARGPDCVVTLTLLGVKIADISMNLFVQDNWVSDVSFARTDDNLILFELDPNSGVGVFLACTSAEITRIEPYRAPVDLTMTRVPGLD
ncbi:Imm50 family immunity protein [Paraburkholderia metrosideri]|jgi:hypothetical protein|uniref:Immunity protein 50 n=1 Tax=Paraburkholderia metrosideri TaxID=580937 RepID=A0ABM8NFL3_9BURK|nr:Imm50 family immunity protein [Paraburkholderia metrosideri]CAD6522670.1 hypothetical protein LMG28140_01412 [Paraburkholderia metrosideri]